VGCNLAGGGSCLNRFAANETGATQVMTDATPGTDPFDWLRTGTRRVGETATWGRMVGVRGGTDSKAGVGGMDFSLSGGIVGIDHVFDEDFLAGVAVQYTTDDLDFKGSVDDADIDSFEVGAYGSWGDTRLYLNTNVSYIWHDFNVRRIGAAGNSFGKYSGNTVSAYAEGGKIYESGDVRIQPILAVG
jgi:outer membrane autotransporter protein